MSTLTPQQLSTLRAFVAGSADPAISFARDNGQTDVLRGLLNATASPVVQSWATNVDKQQVLNAVAENAAQADNISAQRQWAFDKILSASPLDASLDKIRSGVVATVAANTGDPQAMRRGVLRAMRAPATVAQAAIGGTDQVADTITAKVLSYYGTLDSEDVRAILA